MRLHGPAPPQGKNSRSLLFSLLPPHLQYSPPQTSGGAAPLLPGMRYEDLDIMAYEIDWIAGVFQQRIPLTINASQVPSTQTDFPLLINDTYTDLIGEVEAELRFAGADNIQLDYEIEFFDNATGELVAWVKKPSVSDGDVINIYFDNPGALDEQDPGAVWSDYNAVYHLNQTSFGASSTIDSTSNNLDGTPQSMDGTNQVAGQIDGSLDFNGTDEFILVTDNSLLEPGTGAFTVSAWVRPDANSRNDIMGKQRNVGPNDGWFFNMSNDATDRILSIQMRDSGTIRVKGTLALTLGTLHHVVFTYDGSDNASGVRLFIDGVEDTLNIADDTLVGGITNDVEFNIANAGSASPSTVLAWNGIVDEVNISDIEKTPDFITTSFNNQDDQGTFYSTGTVESIPVVDTMEYES